MFEIINLENLRTEFNEKFDLFICFNSFEERCTSIASYIPVDLFGTFLILSNEVLLENEEENLHKLANLLPDDRTIIEKLNLSLPVNVADIIIDRLVNISESHQIKRVFIDITTFTHETLLMLLAIFRERFIEAKIICGYNNAKEYSIDKEDIQSKWLSRGIGEVRSVLGYPGNLKPSQNNLLIVIVGYEFERAARIIDEIDPDYLLIGYNTGKNATTEKDRDASAGYLRLLKNMAAYYEESDDFMVPSDNPYEAYKAMCEKIDTIDKDINITIVPMNNKLSTLGVALIGLTRPEIQICYAPALIYNTSSYSSPGHMCYVFSFDVPPKIENQSQEV